METKPSSVTPAPLDRAKARRAPSPRHRIEARALAEVGLPWHRVARRGWEKFGDVVVLQFLPRVRVETRRALAHIVAQELAARTVAEDLGGVRGALRRPRVRVLVGDETK